MAVVVDVSALDEIVQYLRGQGRSVIAPTVRDSVIVPDLIDSADELPVGWSEDQDGGRYRLVPTGTDQRFASSSPSDSWKRFLSPPETLLVRVRSAPEGLVVEPPRPEPAMLAFFGIRSCDVAAIGLLDRIFLAPGAVDPTYAARRNDVFIVAAACANPGNTCFCASMQTGPSPTAGFDLAIAELHDDQRHEFVVTAGSDRGAELLSNLPSLATTAPTTATPAHEADVAAQHEQAVAAMGRRLDADDPLLAAANLDHPRWDDVAERCLSCGNCTMVCPTCFCGSTQDRTGLLGDDAERWRVWDSCFTADFSSLHGKPVRATTKSRYRQWLLHKLVTWHDQFGSSGCVGCGRCITSCPVGIDLTAEIRAMAHP